MANRANIMKLLQEIRSFAELTNRRPHPRPLGLLVMQMRPPVVRPALPRRKLDVTINLAEHPGIPHPVKITHVKTDSFSAEPEAEG